MIPTDAIETLENLQEHMEETDFIDRCALDMAIEALKEMSVEEYRQRLITVFHRTDHDELLTYVVMPKEEEFKSLEYILQKQPFEPRPHGEWIIRGDNTFITCSKCGYVKGVNSMYFRTRFDPLPYYCENCGADMRARILDEAVDGAGKDGNVKEGEAE